LLGTSFGKAHFRAYPIKQIIRHAQKAFMMSTPTIFNAGELSDATPSHPNMIKLMDLFQTQSRHKLLLLTKSADVAKLCEDASSGRRSNTIYSCTVNAHAVSSRWEVDIPPPEMRLLALKKVMQTGMEGRCRLDPIVPIVGWRAEYADIVERIAETGTKRVTIGTLRGLTRTINFARKCGKDMTWLDYLSEPSGWGLKMEYERRKEVYGFIIDRLHEVGIREIGICKESPEMDEEFGIRESNLKCNCVW
jgi:spore photoproduct lyase